MKLKCSTCSHSLYPTLPFSAHSHLQELGKIENYSNEAVYEVGGEGEAHSRNQINEGAEIERAEKINLVIQL